MHKITSALLGAFFALVPACRGSEESSNPAQKPADRPHEERIDEDQQAIGGFSASQFQFTTQVEDDKEGIGGGYQVAETLLRFVDGRQNPTAIWACKTIVGMPIRTQKFSHVSPARAAEIAADVATRASSVVMHSRASWLRVAFCTSLQNEMNSDFADSYKGLGARAYIR